MVKHTQTNRRVFDHFVGLALKGLSIIAIDLLSRVSFDSIVPEIYLRIQSTKHKK